MGNNARALPGSASLLPGYIDKYDIAIIGSGLVGSSLAHGLKRSQKKIVLVDTKPLSALDETKTRPISLTHSSMCILKKLDVWQHLNPYATPIQTVHVSEQGAFNAVRIRARDYGLEALGYVVPLHHLYNHLIAHLHQQTNLNVQTEISVTGLHYIQDGIELQLSDHSTLQTKLLIAADGAHSTIRDLLNIQTSTQHTQEQVIVANLTASHAFTAYERFTPEGIIALLPQAHNRCGLVWTTREPAALLNLSDKDFLNLLQEKMGYKLGKLSNLSPRFSQALEFNMAHEQVRPHCVLLGNAAHTFYPIAAQGFNLSLSDMAALVDIIESQRPLEDYLQLRKPIQDSTALFTQSLAAIFTDDNLIKKIGRRSALGLLIKLPFLKNKLARFAMGQ